MVPETRTHHNVQQAVPFFWVKDIDRSLAFYVDGLGRPFVGNGMWVTEIRDPDGYQLCFESPTDAPEESEYHG
jgi:catechol 2,3-dioxygenase-like lactoylglutathione lyase family enzyme